MPCQDIVHPVPVNTLPPDDRDGIMEHIYTIGLLHIALKQDPHRSACPGQGNENNLIPLFSLDLLCRAGNRRCRHFGVKLHGLEKHVKVCLGGDIFYGKHFRIVNTPLNQLFPLFCSQWRHHPSNILQKYGYVFWLISAKHGCLLPQK